MKHLFTHCPRCRGQFYVEEEKRRGGYAEVVCPYCRLNYRDVWDGSRTRKAEYYWELYSGLYPYLRLRGGSRKQLKIGGGLLLFSLFLFSLGIVSVFLLEGVTELRGGIALGGTVFTMILTLGAWHTYRGKSFAVSLTGCIFAILNSFLWGGLNYDKGFLALGALPPVFYLLITLFISSLALILIVMNRNVFRYGY